MKDQELIDNVTAANPVRVAELGGTAPDSLLREILAGTRPVTVRTPPARRRWPVIALPVVTIVAVVTLVTVVFGMLRPEPIPAQTLVSGGAAHDVLTEAARRAETTRGSGRFWHSLGETRQLIHRSHRGNRYLLEATTPIEGWAPADRRDGEGVTAFNAAKLRPLTPADALAYRKDGSPKPNENPDPEMGIVVPDPPMGPELGGDGIYEGDVTRLPAAEPDRFRRGMLTWIRDHGGLPGDTDAWLFREGLKILDTDSRPVPPKTRAAVYRMLATLPGLRNLGPVKDPLGRPAVAVAMTETSDKLGTLEWRVYLSPDKDLLMGLQAVVIKPGKTDGHIPPGTAQYTRVVRMAEWTDGCPQGKLPSAQRPCP